MLAFVVIVVAAVMLALTRVAVGAKYRMGLNIGVLTVKVGLLLEPPGNQAATPPDEANEP